MPGWVLVLVYVGVALLAAAGLAVLARPRRITDEEYEAMRGKGAGPGNALSRAAGDALLGVQGILEPGRDRLREAKEERVEADGSGDPPDPDEAPRRFP